MIISANSINILISSTVTPCECPVLVSVLDEMQKNKKSFTDKLGQIFPSQAALNN